ncbi:Cas9 inhibitor AcrIIA9 family protein [Erysipelatoclostridium sp. An173]|uniref:Cas9 inhibitor AcrIIA9 family protein n=1 Tax=Erysipelatoclostridium sp. An173 TaxID=1965571 RepID=UPI0032085FD6
MSLWDLLNEPKEEMVKEEAKSKEAPTKPEKEAAAEREVKEETKQTKKTAAKKETKSSTKTNVQSLEQQLANADKNTKVIYDYLIAIPGMEEKMKNPNKSLREMNVFIRNKARNMAVDGCAMVEDKEVFGWAVHYYDEENPE